MIFPVSIAVKCYTFFCGIISLFPILLYFIPLLLLQSCFHYQMIYFELFKVQSLEYCFIIFLFPSKFEAFLQQLLSWIYVLSNEILVSYHCFWVNFANIREAYHSRHQAYPDFSEHKFYWQIRKWQFMTLVFVVWDMYQFFAMIVESF